MIWNTRWRGTTPFAQSYWPRKMTRKSLLTIVLSLQILQNNLGDNMSGQQWTKASWPTLKRKIWIKTEEEKRLSFRMKNMEERKAIYKQTSMYIVATVNKNIWNVLNWLKIILPTKPYLQRHRPSFGLVSNYITPKTVFWLVPVIWFETCQDRVITCTFGDVT